MHDALELFLYRLDDAWVAVAQVEHADPSGEVDPALTVFIPHFGILGMRHILLGGSCRAIRHEAFLELVQLGIGKGLRHGEILIELRRFQSPPTQTYLSSVNSSRP